MFVILEKFNKRRGCPKSSEIRNSRHPEFISGSDY